MRRLAAFREGLRELGYVDPALAADLVRLKVHVIVTIGGAATKAAKQVTRTIPIVMSLVTDSVESGLVGSLARPGRNVTGTSIMAPDLAGKQFELLKQALPELSRKPGGVAWANPNLDVAYSEAWVAVDEKTATILEVPAVKGGRYYTWQMLNGWGETVLNINERTFKDHPSGTFALVLKGSNLEVPAGALKVELPSKKSRALVRVELGSNPKEAERLQHQFAKAARAPIRRSRSKPCLA